MPVKDKVAVYAPAFDTNTTTETRTISYADTSHIATAAMTDCEKLYTGDSDFEEIKELETEVV
jgi:predicted nucleic acid-binding protein